VFAVLGKITDWLIQYASKPFLRWQDSFSSHAGGA
jgi:sulfonate transport system permease protein